MIPDVISLTCAALDAGFSERPRGQKRRHPNEAPTGSLWRKTVPGARPIVPFILDFARRGGELSFCVNGRHVATGRIDDIQAESEGLRVYYTKAWLDHNPTNERLFVPYPNEKMKSLCQGRPTTFGTATVTMDKAELLFDTSLDGGTAVLSWPRMHVSFRKWFFRISAGISRIEIGPSEGEIVFDGWVDVFTPRLVWGD